MGEGPRMVATKKGVVLTYGKDIWRLECTPKECQWKEKEQKLQIERYGHMILALPSDKLDCNPSKTTTSSTTTTTTTTSKN